jgi:hypothetical protein
MRKLVLGILSATALAVGTSANAQTATITFPGTPGPVNSGNDFAAELLGNYGLSGFISGTSDISLSTGATLTFYYLGSESGFIDRIAAGSVTGVENEANHFATGGLLLGSDVFGAGSLIGDIWFTSNYGGPATIGDLGVGIFLPAGFTSGTGVTEFFLGYDDQLGRPDDDNHDDFLVRVVVSPAVPEPATWAMMLLGFGAAGFALRRRRAPLLTQAA